MVKEKFILVRFDFLVILHINTCLVILGAVSYTYRTVPGQAHMQILPVISLPLFTSQLLWFPLFQRITLFQTIGIPGRERKAIEL